MSATPVSAPFLAQPDDATVERAIEMYAQAVRKAYGRRVIATYLFGSRSRGDHSPESDADIAVVLADGDWSYWQEKFRLADIEYDILVETGADIQAWPVSEAEWHEPERHANSSLLKAMHRDACLIGSRA